MNHVQWFADHLRSSGEDFAWAIEQVPQARRALAPPTRLGAWDVTRHVFHPVYYEQRIALPSMHQWLGGLLPDEAQIDEDAAWATNASSAAALVAAFGAGRTQQLELLTQLTAVDWQSVRDTLWGPVPLRWVVTKTYQHTAEHINDVLRIALFWDFYAEEEQ